MSLDLKCSICASVLYNTDECIAELIYHCSSPAARFWDYDRGSIEQIKSKEHWDQSRLEMPNGVKNEAS